jgi:hypothetical protein
MTGAASRTVPEYGRLSLHELTFVSEGDHIIIGRQEIDSFAVFSDDAAALIRRLQRDGDLAAAGSWYQDTYGESADLGEFVELLTELGFVRRAGDAPGTADPGQKVRWQRLGRVVLSPVALALYAGFAAVAVAVMVAEPALRPGPSALFFTRSVLVVMGIGLIAQAAGVAWHEAFHVLAGRRLGLPSRLSIGGRLYFVVIQTTLTGLMGVPARKRILPFLAGLIADTLAVCTLTGIGYVGLEAGWPPWIWRAAVTIAYLTLLRMVWQAMVFMETDLCHVLASVLQCPGLHEMTRAHLRARYARLRGRPEAAGYTDGWSDRDRRIVARYAPFVAGGSALLIAVAAAGTVPALAGLGTRVYQGLSSGSTLSESFWDSAVAGALIVAQFALLAAIKIRDRRVPSRRT